MMVVYPWIEILIICKLQASWLQNILLQAAGDSCQSGVGGVLCNAWYLAYKNM